jgi:hypothetical protein
MQQVREMNNQRIVSGMAAPKAQEWLPSGIRADLVDEPVASPNSDEPPEVEPRQSTSRKKPTYYDPRCPICIAHTRDLPNAQVLRRHIDGMYVYGFLPAEIGREVQKMTEGWPRPISRHSVWNHTRRHLPHQDEALRRIMERAAKQLAIDTEEGVQSFLTPEAVIEGVVHLGWARLVDGDVVVQNVGELMKAASVLAAIREAGKKQGSSSNLRAEFSFMTSALREILTKEQFQQFYDRVRAYRRSAPPGDLYGEPPK